MKKLLTSAAIVGALFASTSAMAGPTAIVATENFSSATGSIIGQSGGTGWAGAWQSALGAGASAPTVVSSQGNNALQLSTASTNAASRTLAETLSGDVLIQFEFSYTGVLGRNDFLGLWFGSSNGPNIGLKANCDTTGACINDAFARTSSASTQMLSQSNLMAEQVYVLFGHLYKTGSSTTYNRFDAWLNPSAGELATLTTPDASSTGASLLTSFNTIGFRTENIDNGVTVRVDNVQVSVVPEPASIALFGASLLALCGIRRRRSR
jgi:hypothetical protein